ncbi:surface-adhesin E family protein [Rodentibacter caecimuris]|uniref:Surface-adhesin protein n=1 Tax=Rodentibacter caecimuris TaxID=1796644 RepID=A0ABX3L003_9PAST|nr:hypothetical protein BKG89_02110 [Rodentibacter heylii]
MKKLILYFFSISLSACSLTQQAINIPKEVTLETPTKVRDGYIKLVPDAEYYVDSSSIWIDNEDSNLVHFDAVINLLKGLYVYKPDTKRYARSVRQYKILNCANYRLTQIRTDFYDNFWGEGLRAAPKNQPKHTVRLQPNSSLYTLGQIICANTKNK